MARIEFPLEESYQAAEWSIWEAVRELVVNAKDGERRNSGKGQMSVKFRKSRKLEGAGTLKISNKRIHVPLEALLIGWSESRDREDCVGQFGEGLVMSLLTLARLEKEGAGISVVVHNQDEVWRPCIEASQNGFKANVLVIKSRKLRQPREDFVVAIEGLSAELWEEFKHLFLWSDPDFDETQTSKPSEYAYDRILLQEQYAGMLFIKGVFVKRYDDLSYGYDLNMELNRDRKMVSEWDLKWKLARLLADATANDPQKFGDKLFGMLEEGTGLEVAEPFSLKTSHKVVDLTTERFNAKYGEDAVPVANMSESRELEHYGKKGVVVSSAMRELVEQRKGTFEAVKTKAAESTVQRYSWGDLSDAEKHVLETACKLVQMSSITGSADYDVMAHVSVVDFADAKLLGRFHPKTQEVELSKERLSDLHDTVITLIHEVSHIHGRDGTHSHVESQVEVAASIIIALLAKLDQL